MKKFIIVFMLVFMFVASFAYGYFTPKRYAGGVLTEDGWLYLEVRMPAFITKIWGKGIFMKVRVDDYWILAEAERQFLVDQRVRDRCIWQSPDFIFAGHGFRKILLGDNIDCYDKGQYVYCQGGRECEK